MGLQDKKTKQKETPKNGTLRMKFKCKQQIKAPDTHTNRLLGLTVPSLPGILTALVPLFHPVPSAACCLSRLKFHFSGVQFICFVPIWSAGSILGLRGRNSSFLFPDESGLPRFVPEWSMKQPFLQGKQLLWLLDVLCGPGARFSHCNYRICLSPAAVKAPLRITLAA